jgi:beta-glucosidase-like glycosyl hydrolase
MKSIYAVLLCALLFFSIPLSRYPVCEASRSVEFRYFFRDDPVETLAHLSLEQKVGQILIFGFRGSRLDREFEDWLASGRLGNVKVFLRNVRSKEQMRELTDHIVSLALHSPTGIPPFIATDMEGGTVNHIRYRGIYLAPAAGLLGATGNVEYGRDAARLIALTLYNHGVNMNLAPCVDVLTNERNRVIGPRSYSSEPEIVAEMARAFITEHRRLGIMTTAKHFPGHGMTRYDSHLFSAVVDLDEEQLREHHVMPYISLIEHRHLDGVMVSHIIYDAVDPFFPASLSHDVIEGYLREGLGFDGIVVTDDLEMQGTQTYTHDILKTFVLSFRAGNDLFLISHTEESQHKVMENVVSLFERGILSEEELDRRVLRILAAKRRYLARFYGTHGGSVVQEQQLSQAIEDTVRLTRDGIVLMSSNLNESTPDFFKGLIREDKRGLILSPSTSFAIRAKRYLPLWDVLDIEFYPDKGENRERLASNRDRLAEYDFILLGFANERHIPWAWTCVREGIPFAILSYDNPQYALHFSSHALFMVTCFAPYNPGTDALFTTVFETGRFSGYFPYRF